MDTRENQQNEDRQFAVFQSGTHQYKASIGDTILIEMLETETDSKEHSFNQVLLTVNGEDIKVGQPLVEGASVTAKILGTEKQKKVIKFQHRKRKNHRKKIGHRQELMKVKIESINF